MCKAFSGIIRENGDVIWYFGIDSHEDIIDKYSLSAQIPLVDSDHSDRAWARFEVVPKRFDNSDALYLNYFNVQKWGLGVDESSRPSWFSKIHEDEIWKAHKIWYDKLKPYLNFKDFNFLKHIKLRSNIKPVWDKSHQLAAENLSKEVMAISKFTGFNNLEGLFNLWENHLSDMVGSYIYNATEEYVAKYIEHWRSRVVYALSCFNVPTDVWTLPNIDDSDLLTFNKFPFSDWAYLLRCGYQVAVNLFNDHVWVGAGDQTFFTNN